MKSDIVNSIFFFIQAMAALKENHRMHSELTAKVANKAAHDDDDNMKEIRAVLKVWLTKPVW